MLARETPKGFGDFGGCFSVGSTGSGGGADNKSACRHSVSDSLALITRYRSPHGILTNQLTGKLGISTEVREVTAHCTLAA